MYPGVDPTDVVKEVASVGGQMHEDALNGDLVQKAVKQAIEDEFAVTEGWQQKELQFVISCPSGQKCLAKRLNTLDLLEADLLDEIDYFTKRLFPAELDSAGNPVEREFVGSFTLALKDPVKRKRIFDLLDKLLNISITRPKIHVLPNSVDIEQYRNWEGPALPRGEVWANMVDFQDKIFIFGELNRPLDEIKTFRIEQEVSVANLAAMESVSGEAK